MSLYLGEVTVLPRYFGEVSMELFLDQQNLVVLEGLKSALLGGASLNNATTTARVFTLGGTTLSNTTMSFATGSAGRYEGTFSVITSLIEGVEYRVKVEAITGGSTIAFWDFRAIAIKRRE